MKILILGGGLQGLSCGSSLFEKHNLSIVSNDYMVRKSRFFERVYSEMDATYGSLDTLLRDEHFDLILPVSDQAASFTSKNKEQIEKQFGVRCAVPDYDRVSRVEDKSRFMEFCHSNGIPHPKTCSLTDDNYKSISSLIGFPALIKPNYSVGARGITRVDSIDDLYKLYPLVSGKYGPCTLQELVENDEYYYNVMLYRDSRGEFLAHTILKIVRMYPISGGSSSCCISVENEELLNVCKDCLEKLDWNGMADFDVLQCKDSGAYRIIEINPRVPASLKAAAVSGVNFPEIIVNDYLGTTVPKYSYVPGNVLRFLGLDILWFIKSPLRFYAKPSWFRFWGKRLFYQDLFINDASTWWTWLIGGILKFKTRNKSMRKQ